MNSQIRNEIIGRWYGGQSMRGVVREMKLARKTVKVAPGTASARTSAGRRLQRN